MKTTLELRPVYHRKEDRIRAHIVLCWLALLLIRVAENRTQDTWRNLRLASTTFAQRPPEPAPVRLSGL
jgi:transposase